MGDPRQSPLECFGFVYGLSRDPLAVSNVIPSAAEGSRDVILSFTLQPTSPTLNHAIQDLRLRLALPFCCAAILSAVSHARLHSVDSKMFRSKSVCQHYIGARSESGGYLCVVKGGVPTRL